MTPPEHAEDERAPLDLPPEPRCACGHTKDEHDSQCCLVDDCGCFYFDEDPG